MAEKIEVEVLYDTMLNMYWIRRTKDKMVLTMGGSGTSDIREVAKLQAQASIEKGYKVSAINKIR